MSERTSPTSNATIAKRKAISRLIAGQREVVRRVKDQSETSALSGRAQCLEREVRLSVQKECGTTPRQVRKYDGVR
jgi:hypothetical protein